MISEFSVLLDKRYGDDELSEGVPQHVRRDDGELGGELDLQSSSGCDERDLQSRRQRKIWRAAAEWLDRWAAGLREERGG